MSICKMGLSEKLRTTSITVIVRQSEPLLKLANLLDWEYLGNLSMEDLKKTEKGFWMLGRKLYLRIHLAAFILKFLLKLTDRELESRILQTPLLQVFCGYGIVHKWRCPDFTKIEEFRNRLNVETKKKIGDYVLTLAVKAGFADPSWMDVDSTVQEANMSYPSDAALLKKISLKVKKVVDYFKEKGHKAFKNISIDFKKISKKAQEYFFLSKNSDMLKKRSIFKDYFQTVKSELYGAINIIGG